MAAVAARHVTHPGFATWFQSDRLDGIDRAYLTQWPDIVGHAARARAHPGVAQYFADGRV